MQVDILIYRQVNNADLDNTDKENEKFEFSLFE